MKNLKILIISLVLLLDAITSNNLLNNKRNSRNLSRHSLLLNENEDFKKNSLQRASTSDTLDDLDTTLNDNDSPLKNKKTNSFDNFFGNDDDDSIDTSNLVSNKSNDKSNKSTPKNSLKTLKKENPKINMIDSLLNRDVKEIDSIFKTFVETYKKPYSLNQNLYEEKKKNIYK